jgi:hypothetical protein
MKYTFLSICCLLMVNIAVAQFSIYGVAGMQGLKYKTDGGSQSIGFGYGGGLGYSISMSSSWKICLAAEYAMYNSKASFGTLSDRYNYGTGEGKSRFSYSLKDYEEKQNVAMASIPVTLQYQTGDSIKFCVSGGLKFGLPLSAKASINPGTVSASGEYEYEGQTYADLPQHGYPDGTKLPSTQCDIDLGYSAAVTLETGLILRRFYAGVYLDYGLTNMQKTKDKHPLEYQESHSSTLVHNSILNTALIDKINIINAGLKIKFLF